MNNAYLRIENHFVVGCQSIVNAIRGYVCCLIKARNQTIQAAEALEEALCFGRIDGQIQRTDDTTYRKYFSKRRANRKWSEKNKALVKHLEASRRMSEFGRAKIQEAKENGHWDAPKQPEIPAKQIASLTALGFLCV